MKSLKQLITDNPELWDIFTLREEYSPFLVDRYGRFPYYACKNRTILEPTVSKYLIDKENQIDYPESKKFGICLTHDIDLIYYSKKRNLYN